MILHLISSQSVISKVIADMDMSEQNIRISDMIEWVGEALGKIGGIQEMSPQETILPVCNHQVRIPCDSKNITQVAFSDNEDGPWYPTKKATGSFHINQVVSSNSETIIREQEYVAVYQQLHHRENLSYDEARDILLKDEKARDTIKAMITNNNTGRYSRHNTNFGSGIQYFIKPGYIVLNANNGFVKIAYNSIPRDEFGYPMVPDNDAYIEAIYWYIVTKLIYPDFLKGKINTDRYAHAQLQYTMYSRRAYGEVKFPNLDEMESIKNTWNRMYPVLDEHDTFYSSVGDREHIYNRLKPRRR